MKTNLFIGLLLLASFMAFPTNDTFAQEKKKKKSVKEVIKDVNEKDQTETKQTDLKQIIEEKVTDKNPEQNKSIEFSSQKDVGVVQTHHTYKFGSPLENGRKISKTFYDENGNVTQLNVYDSDEAVEKKEKYFYDQNGNKTEFVLYNSDEEIEEKEIYRYEGNRLVELSHYNSEGELENKISL